MHVACGQRFAGARNDDRSASMDYALSRLVDLWMGIAGDRRDSRRETVLCKGRRTCGLGRGKPADDLACVDTSAGGKAENGSKSFECLLGSSGTIIVRAGGFQTDVVIPALILSSWDEGSVGRMGRRVVGRRG